MIRYPSLEAVVRANEQQTGRPGLLRDQASLEATLARPRSGFGGVETYPSLLDKAAVLLHGLSSTQPFLDGNKRTAWLVCVSFLRLNGRALDQTSAAGAEALALCAGTSLMSVERVAEWLAVHSDPRRRYSRTTVYLHDLLSGTSGPELRDVVALDCRLIGPMVLRPDLSSVNLQGSTWEGGLEFEQLLWDIADDATPRIGVVPVSNAVFVECTFVHVGVAGTHDEQTRFMAELQVVQRDPPPAAG